MSQRSRQKSRNKGRQSGARGRSGVASTSVAASAAVATSDPASMGSASPAVSGSTALSQAGSAAWGGELLPCDEALFDRALTQWQFGDWNRLAGLDSDEFAHHPRRARLALLAAAGHQQLGQLEETRRLVRLAHEWGCDRTLIERVLISGVYNTLGCANALAGRSAQALGHFEAAIQAGLPGGETRLLGPVRIGEQLSQLGFRSADGYQKVEALEKSLTLLKKTPTALTPEPAPSKQAQKFSSDADIDDFIEDIAPFFRNRTIVYVDVGAYVGEVFTKLMASKKIKLQEAHLIEPNPESYQKLQDAVKASKLSSCNTYHFAISSNPGTASFKAAKSMTKRVRADISSESASNLFETECRKLDEIAELFTDGRAHLMKLDVEGEELDVLQSAEHLLKEQRIDVLYVEVGLNRAGTQQTYFGDLDAVLQSYGYRVFKIYEQKNEWIDDSPLLRRCNAAYMSSRFESAHPYSKTLKASVT